MINEELYLITLSHCVFVNGATRGVVCDIQRNGFFIIPKEMPNFIESAKGKKVKTIYSEYGSENIEIVSEYLNFLLENELVYLSNTLLDVERFPTISLEDHNTTIIDSAIIDVGKFSHYDIYEIINQLTELGCKYLQVRFFKDIDYSEIEGLLINTDQTEIESLEIIAPYTNEIDKMNFENIFVANQRLTLLTFYRSPFSDSKNYFNGCFSLNYVETNCNSSLHCGIVHPSYFVANTPLYIESKKYNNCLNRKIGIDSDGEIKNCPSMMNSYGNVGEVSLKKAIEMKGLKDTWVINKDRIDTCKDCEFRYVCTDCRAYLQNPSDIYSKPLKCGYNPYSGIWEDWTMNFLSKVAIDYYKLHPIIENK
jgi:SPASM domain peptide maturase of grasp-with-spasm system